MPLIKDDDVVQTIAADRADDAFDVRILPGRARGGADDRQIEGLDRPTERCVAGRVAVVEEKPRVRVMWKGLAELLSGPCGRRVLRHIDMQGASPVMAARTITRADVQAGQASRRPTQSSRSDQRTVGVGRVRG
jgi:hypothetical protein